jgi:hypothetical protein
MTYLKEFLVKTENGQVKLLAFTKASAMLAAMELTFSHRIISITETAEW